jgi:pimeloyl-ACP methyl ester carboxylesterase
LDFEEYARILSSLETPVWLTHCEDDPLIEAEIVDELARALHDREFLTLKTGGHNPQKEFAVELAASLQHWILSRGFFDEPPLGIKDRAAG